MVKLIKVILIILCIFIAFVLGSQNPQIVQINYIVASQLMPLAAVMSICFIIGLLFGCFVSFKMFSKLKWQNYRLKQNNHKLAATKDS